jgi:hypothetical protein
MLNSKMMGLVGEANESFVDQWAQMNAPQRAKVVVEFLRCDDPQITITVPQLFFAVSHVFTDAVVLAEYIKLAVAIDTANRAADMMDLLAW